MPRHRSAREDYLGCVAGNLRAAARVATRVYDDALRPHGVRITQVAILAQLRRLQPVSATDLSSALASERSALARDVAILERDGLVTTSAAKDDKRVREIRLTARGVALLAACAPAWRAAQEAVRKALSTKRVNDLIALSEKFVAELSSD